MIIVEIAVGLLAVLVLYELHTVRVQKRKIQELAMQVSLLNQENEHMRKKIDKVMK